MTNVHHLELFYYVARHEGITAAVRKMPYGIQQPAVSGQLLQLEKQLGVKLFHRRPFALTPSGEELYDFIYPFFSRLPDITNRLSGEENRHLRLAASSVVLTNHLPVVLESLRKVEPDLRLTLRDYLPAGVEEALLSHEVDVAISVIPSRPAPGIQTEPLLDLPLALIAPPESNLVQSWPEIADTADPEGNIYQPLVAVPIHETISRLFKEGLSDRGLQWESTIEANSLELVLSYAARGYGYGLLVQDPGISVPKGLQLIPLDGFPVMRLGILHRGDLKPLVHRFVEHTRAYVERLRKLKKKKASA